MGKQADGTEMKNYAYDPNGNQISVLTGMVHAPNGDESLYIYLAGSTDFDALPYELNTYNAFNQLTQTLNEKGTAKFAYKPDGMRLNKTINGTKTTHIWDGSNIVMDLNGSNAVIDRYTYGIGLISNNSRYYIYNAHGDVVQLANSTGTVTKNYHYDAFGVEENIDPADPNPFRYCAEYYDKEIDKIYLRARYYVPRLGRFTSEDPIRDGLNWYTYCENNPVMRIDPWGLDSYILYDPDQHRGYGPFKLFGFSVESHVDSMSDSLKDIYRTDVFIISTLGWTADTFTEWWNGLEGNIDAIVVFGHGSSNRLQFDKLNDEGSRSENANFGITITQMSNLQGKNMDMMVLFGCNTGSGENNIAMAFTERIGQGGRVIAPDGVTTWYPNFGPSWVGQADVKVGGNGYFVFYREDGVVNNQSILQNYIDVRSSPGFYITLFEWIAPLLRNE